VESLKELLSTPMMEAKLNSLGKNLTGKQYELFVENSTRVTALEKQLHNMFVAIDTFELDHNALKDILTTIHINSSDSESALIQKLKSSVIAKDEANATLRKLYSESQRDSLTLTEKAQDQAKQLREEFDELATLFEATVTELDALKANLGNSDISSLKQAISILERENDSLKYESIKCRASRGYGNIRSVSPSREHFNEADSLRLHLKQADIELAKCNEELQSAISSIYSLENRLMNLERERDRLVDDRNRDRENFEQEIYHAVNIEKQRARDILNLKIEELNSSFDSTMNDMMRKHNHFEQMLEETERLLSAERESFRIREQNLLEDLRFFQDKHKHSLEGQNSRFVYEIEQERAHLRHMMNDVENENRNLKKTLESQSNHYLKERYDLLGEISMLKQDLEALEQNQDKLDSSRIIKKLQDQKSVIALLK
jgi:chromosome segregation ATPase